MEYHLSRASISISLVVHWAARESTAVTSSRRATTTRFAVQLTIHRGRGWGEGGSQPPASEFVQGFVFAGDHPDCRLTQGHCASSVCCELASDCALRSMKNFPSSLLFFIFPRNDSSPSQSAEFCFVVMNSALVLFSHTGWLTKTPSMISFLFSRRRWCFP